MSTLVCPHFLVCGRTGQGIESLLSDRRTHLDVVEHHHRTSRRSTDDGSVLLDSSLGIISWMGGVTGGSTSAHYLDSPARLIIIHSVNLGLHTFRMNHMLTANEYKTTVGVVPSLIEVISCMCDEHRSTASAGFSSHVTCRHIAYLTMHAWGGHTSSHGAEGGLLVG